MQRRILLVDDNADILALASTSLGRVGGHDVRTAGSGPDCLALLEQWTPDVVVLDVRMPDMDGPGVLAAIRADPRTSALPVVFLTASVVPAEVAELTCLPISGVLVKPFDPMRLPEELAATLGW